ncbi:hypothetical protein TNIN_391391 [Trichonephila inaurata madagascariensis]|uniref:C2H2-type domain-containing protein n=1 Tax=Trichonephila inaurata madagascariensis TaxID=2747483 RepID=A0A8X6XRY8_9ARAC|nr:hypothetical protein TNIN_391391 [Trichonephila inaurata madagascariensis]
MLRSQSKEKFKVALFSVNQDTGSVKCCCGRIVKNLSFFGTHRRFCPVYKQAPAVCIPPVLTYKCSYCFLTFKCKKDLLMHHKAQHKWFVVNYLHQTYHFCIIKFLSIHSYVRSPLAASNIQTTKYPFSGFKCQFCGRTFNQKAHLVQHLRIHTGERPFKCSKCDKCFKRNESLRYHFMTVHGFCT